MNKVTKKELRKTALKLLPAIYDSAVRTGEEDGLFQHEDWRTGICLDAFLLAEAFEDAAAYRDAESEPKLKQLDQSVFDGLDAKWRFAVKQHNGYVIVCDQKPFLAFGGSSWDWNGHNIGIGGGYDTTDWQNSLIERKELTGRDLTEAMFKRGDNYVMCVTGILRKLVIIDTLEDGKFYSFGTMYENPIPINNQGEPLTQSEAGL